ncbi:hypothetical protein B0H12DRAFT_1111673 [Mycena haematopus]|nr:hypothetical protein B0H12DRAFT_1111673 [Mycena haematopus]
MCEIISRLKYATTATWSSLSLSSPPFHLDLLDLCASTNIMRFALALASLAFFAGINAQECTAGSCWNSPANATAHGCQTWDGGVNAWATCGFVGAVTCTTCLPCATNTTACYTSPTEAEAAGCSTWAGGVDVWATCGFDGAVRCLFVLLCSHFNVYIDYLHNLRSYCDSLDFFLCAVGLLNSFV